MTHRLITAERAAFGLVAWLDQTRVTLPLKGVDCAFAVTGDLLHVEIDQVFHQDAKKPLDVTYSFPLPSDAAIYCCEMQVNGRIIRARVEEREAAVRIARQKRAEGYRTGLAEMERDNLFTLSLGNVQPGDLIVIRLAYFQTLTRLEDWTSFSVPFCPGIRYIPGKPLLRSSRGRGTVDDTDQVPDASRITPPRIDQFDPEAAFLAIHGRIDQPVGSLKDISSPSHPVVVRDGESRWTVALADNAAVPDRDFVLRWTEVESAEVIPSAWMDRQGDEVHALLRLRAPVDVQAAEKPGQDFYFLTDRSGSMEGLKWTKAVQAFQEFLKVLGPKDRVWATFFETSFQDLAEKPLPAAKLLQDRNVMQLERLGTGGGTELLPALNHVLEKAAEHSSGMATSVVLITDGQVGNEAEILTLAGQHGSLRMHTFGIDTAVNEGFLKKLASQSHGTCCLLNPDDDIVGAVVRLANRLAKPVLTSIRVGAGWELPTEKIPDLHAGEVCLVPLRRSGEAVPLRLTGRLPDGRDWAHAITPVSAENPAFRLLWLKQRIEHELNAGRSEAAIQLAKAVNLVCKGTAFIAWDEQEKVAVATQAVYQPSQLQLAKNQPAFFARAVALECLSDFEGPPPSDGFRQELFMARAMISPAPRPPAELPPVTRLRELLKRLQPDGGLLGNMLFVAAINWQRVAASSSQPMVLMERLEELERDVTELAQRLEALRRQLAEHCSDLVRDARSLADAMDRHILAASDPVSVGPWKACLESVDLATAWLCKAGPLGEELQRKVHEVHDLERAIRERVNRFREVARASCLAGQA